MESASAATRKPLSVPPADPCNMQHPQVRPIASINYASVMGAEQGPGHSSNSPQGAPPERHPPSGLPPRRPLPPLWRPAAGHRGHWQKSDKVLRPIHFTLILKTYAIFCCELLPPLRLGPPGEGLGRCPQIPGRGQPWGGGKVCNSRGGSNNKGGGTLMEVLIYPLQKNVFCAL
jgi:hypothetical protein